MLLEMTYLTMSCRRINAKKNQNQILVRALNRCREVVEVRIGETISY